DERGADSPNEPSRWRRGGLPGILDHPGTDARRRSGQHPRPEGPSRAGEAMDVRGDELSGRVRPEPIPIDRPGVRVRVRAFRAQALPPAVCVAAGLLLATLPHLLWWSRLGEPVYIADFDEMLYLAYSGQAYFNHPTTLGDPTFVAGGRSIFPDS